MHLILASASPRRAELLRAGGFEFEVRAADVEEVPRDGESAGDYTLRVSLDKARAVAATLTSADAVVLAADTEVVVGGRVLGKPADPADAAAMLRLLSGVVHDVITAVVVWTPEREASRIVTTRVEFAPMTAEEIDWYVGSGEPMGKAGAYGIQGRGARFITRIDGSWSSVVGLPVASVHQLLREVQ